MSFFKIGVDLNGMSASEYLPLYQPFTNRTHVKKGDDLILVKNLK